MNTAQPAITDLNSYLAARKSLLTARQGFFDALRSHLRPEQRPDAERLGDRLATSNARCIEEDDWVDNPVRGYVTVLEAPARGRPFRLCVLQQGNELRVGVRFDARPGSQRSVEADLQSVFQHQPPVPRYLPGAPYGDRMLDWHFNAAGLYQSAQHFEDAVYKVGAIFEAALQSMAVGLPTA